MNLRRHLLEREWKPATAPRPTKRESLNEIEARIVVAVCKLVEETSKAAPDNDRAGEHLDDLDLLVADYRREQARPTKAGR